METERKRAPTEVWSAVSRYTRSDANRTIGTAPGRCDTSRFGEDTVGRGVAPSRGTRPHSGGGWPTIDMEGPGRGPWNKTEEKTDNGGRSRRGGGRMLACWARRGEPACDFGPNSAGARGNKMAISLPCLRVVRLWQHQFESGVFKGARPACCERVISSHLSCARRVALFG